MLCRNGQTATDSLSAENGVAWWRMDL